MLRIDLKSFGARMPTVLMVRKRPPRAAGPRSRFGVADSRPAWVIVAARYTLW
jgi:hypothetical protein